MFITRQAPGSRFVLALVLAAAASTACRAPSPPAAGGDATALPAGTSPYDVETTDIARVLGGMPPVRPDAFSALIGLPGWRRYQDEARDRWSVAWTTRLQPIRAWAGVALKEASSDCRTLLLPFSGTEFLPAYLMFPLCDGYVVVGAEPAGQLPKFESAGAAQAAAMADDVRRAFPEVFTPGSGARGRGRSEKERRPGALTPLLVQLARIDARIVSASRFDLAADGRPLEAIPIRGGNGRPAALSITFELPNGRPQSLVYLPADLDDAAMQRRPAVWTFLRIQAPFATLIAPGASLGRDGHTLLQQLIVDQSRVILAGRPVFQTRPAGWTVSVLDSPPAGAFPPGTEATLAIRKTPPAPRQRR